MSVRTARLVITALLALKAMILFAIVAPFAAAGRPEAGWFGLILVLLLVQRWALWGIYSTMVR